MMKDLAAITKQLRELAEVLNAFKSEAVQLKLVDLLFTSGPEPEPHDRGKPRVPGRKANRRAKATIKEKKAAKAKSKPSALSGGGTALARLIEQGFFKQPRMIGEIVKYTSDQLALKLKPSDFSGKLARYVREGKLSRAKNAENQYEYTQA